MIAQGTLKVSEEGHIVFFDLRMILAQFITIQRIAWLPFLEELFVNNIILNAADVKAFANLKALRSADLAFISMHPRDLVERRLKEILRTLPNLKYLRFGTGQIYENAALQSFLGIAEINSRSEAGY